MKLSLLKRTLEIIPKAGTLHQEYQEQMEKVGKKETGGFYKTKKVQDWAFHAMLENKPLKIKVIGMPYTKKCIRPLSTKEKEKNLTYVRVFFSCACLQLW